MLSASSALVLLLVPGDEVRLTLVGGEQVEAEFIGFRGALVRVEVDGELVEVPLSIVEGAEGPGGEVDLMVMAKARPLPRGAPPPALVGASSFVVPGLGFAMVGEPRLTAAYLAVDVVLIGLVAVVGPRQGDWNSAVPLIGLDLAIRGYAASESGRMAAELRRRRQGELEGWASQSEDPP